MKPRGLEEIVMARMHLLIEGRVQGVWFRATTRDEAERIGVVGWVRNLPDGRVEVLAEGTPEQLDELLEFCRRGPKHAVVTHVEVERLPAEGDLGDRFRVTY